MSENDSLPTQIPAPSSDQPPPTAPTPAPVTHSTRVIVHSLSYAFFSATLIVCNKWALKYFQAPNTLVAVQSLFTAVIAYAFLALFQRRILVSFAEGTPFKTPKIFLWVLICNVLQSVTIACNLSALHYLGVDMVILLRICAMIPIAIGDWLINGRTLPTLASWICFLCIGMSAAFVFGTEHAAVTVLGAFWGLAYFAAISTDQVVLKRFIQSVPMKNVDRIFWMNIFGSLVSAVLAAATGEVGYLIENSASFTSLTYNSVLLSCVLAVGISFSAWYLRQEVSAVTFSLIGVACKIGSMAINFFVLDHLALESLAVIAAGLLSTMYYKEAPPRKQKTDGQEPTTLAALVDQQQQLSSAQSNQIEEMKAAKRSLVILVLIIAGGLVNRYHTGFLPGPVPEVALTPQSEQQFATLSPQVGLTTSSGGDLTLAPTSEWATGSNPLYPLIPPTYSRFRCMGSTFTPSAPWRYRSCYFRSVCYNGNPAQRLTYFASPLDDASAADMGVSTMVPYVSDPRAPAVEYKVDVVRGTIPGHAKWPLRRPWISRPAVMVPSDYFIPGVWTHLLIDNIFPTFRLLEVFGFDPNHVDVAAHWLTYPCPPGSRDDSGCNFSDRRYNPKWGHLMNSGKWNFTKLATAYSDNLRLQPNQTDAWVCFDHVVTGLSLFSDHGTGWSEHGRQLDQPVWTNWGIGPSAERFRQYTLDRARELLPGASRPAEYDVLFLTKGNNSYANNALDTAVLATRLKAYLNQSDSPALRTATVAFPVFLEHYTLLEQMELVSKARVIVSQVGSTSFGAFWLPRGSTLILLFQNELLDFYFWENLPWIHTRYAKYDSKPKEEQIQAVIKFAAAGLERTQRAIQTKSVSVSRV